MFIIDYLKSQRVITDQGFLKVPGRLARTGIQEYRAYELGLRDMDPNKVIRVYRPESEVFSPESMASFEDNPITIEHPREAVTADNWSVLAKGHVRNIRRDGDFLIGDMTITSREAIAALDGGKVEISNGYTNNLVFQAGVTPDGQEYDAIQKNIRGNHVALVDAARCGPACRVSDSNPSGASAMPTKKITLDGLPLEFDENAAVVIEKLVGDRDTARGQVTDLQGQLAAIATTVMVGDTAMTITEIADALAAANTQIEALKKDVMTPDARDAMVADWTKMLADAKRLVPKIDPKGKTCAVIRREVVTTLAQDAGKKVMIDAVLAGVAVADAADESIRTAFNVLSAAPAPVQADDNHIDPVAQALAKDGKTTKDAEPDGRDAYIAMNANAWQTK